MNEKYRIGNTSLAKIRNKNEARVIEMMKQILPEFPFFEPDPLNFEDVYALSLNQLPPRYVQYGTVVLREEVTKEEIEKVVRSSIEKVMKNPTCKKA